MRVLVTGCSGYVGSHVCDTLLKAGVPTYGIDERPPQVSGLDGFLQVDLRTVDAREKFDVVVHLAALIFPRESVTRPADYYDVNVGGTLDALTWLRPGGHFVLASTGSAFYPASPYSHSKIMAERVVKDVTLSTGSRRTIFRFFNVAGSVSGFVRPHSPTHLVARAAVCASTGEELVVNGGDYDTPDGTCVRDYVHPADIASAVKACLDDPSNEEWECLASPTPGGYSNLDVVSAMKRVTGRDFPVRIGPRAPGDAPVFVVPNTSRFNSPKYWLDDMCIQEYEVLR